MDATTNRKPGLDLLRAIAIMLVVVAHSAGLLLNLSSIPYLGRCFTWMVDHSQPVGVLGVELFFVLSGFLIGRILIRTFINRENFSFSDIKNFWIRRWFRTLPNYWLVLTIGIMLYHFMHLQPIVPYQALYYPFLQNLWYPNPLMFFNESWSLSIEEWFYLTLPVWLYIFYRFSPRQNRPKLLLRAFVSYLFVFLMIRFLNAFHPINGTNEDAGIRKVVLFRLDAVMYGVLVAYIHYFRPEVLNNRKKMLLALSVCGVLALFYLITKRDIDIRSSPVATIKFASDAFLYLLLPLFFSLCLPFANSMQNSNSYVMRAAGFVSKISYSMYLTHFTLIFMPFFYMVRTNSTASAAGLYVLYWLLVTGISYIIYKYFEQPIMKYRDRISHK